VTHVVAAKDGTDKAMAARKFAKTALVKPSWLMECYWSMSRRRSLAHLMTPTSAIPVPAPKPSTAEESDDDDEDDFAAAMEEELLND
jgi:RNA polymerase II subunit A-like phosphatase